MIDGQRADRRDVWLPGLVGLVGMLIALMGWGLLVADRQDRLLEETRHVARETREAVELALAEQIDALESLGEPWEVDGPREDWIDAATQRVEQIDGLASVAWIDLGDPNHRVVVGEGDPVADMRLDPQAAERHRHAHVEGPGRDASASATYGVFLPLPTPAGLPGVLVARIRVEPFLRSVLRARASGHALVFSWDGEAIFARGTPTSDPWQRWWRTDEAIALPLGGHWDVSLRPTPELAAARLTPITHYLLAAGLLLSVVLALLAHQLRLVLRQSRFMAASNRALEQRGQELETRVAERTEALQDAVTELEAFNYSVSHDLRSPLAAILNFTAILDEDYRGRPLDAEGRAILGRIRRSAFRGTALIEDLLQLSRAGRAALKLERIDMTALARETFATVRAAEDDGDAEFVVDPLPDAIADRSLVGDVFANLFGNALKYSRGCEKRRIRVSGRRGGGELVYEVADTGHGFDMRFVDKVFGLFERLHADEGIEGTGVGLAMVARIVRRHGGRVWAEAEPGAGARFSFALPDRRAP